MAVDFLAGFLGGCAGIVVGYPLDTIKVHIQTQDHRNPKYKGTWHCFRTLVARESVAGLYRGMSSPMAGVAAVNAIVFGVYGQTQKFLSDGIIPNGEHHYSGHFLAGASAGIAQAPVCSPIELAKTRLQLQTSANPGRLSFSGPMQCLRHIYRTEGIRGVFSGFGITLLREAPSYGVYFVTYEALTQSDKPISTFRMLLAGGLAGIASWIVSYPLDVVKSRLQADSTSKYSGALDCFRKSVQTEGYACLFRGLNSTIIRAFPTNAATFAVVTWTFRLFGKDQIENEAGSTLTTAKVEVVESLKEAAKPSSKSWKSLDRYGESLGDATGNLFSELTNSNMVLHAKASNDRSVAQAINVNSQPFDEVQYFDWTKETIHY